MFFARKLCCNSTIYISWCWLPLESFDSFVYEGGSLQSTICSTSSCYLQHLSDHHLHWRYNYIQQHLLPRESFNSFISQGGIRDVFNLHVCGLSQSHFRLRGSERISEWGRIWASISIGTYQGNLFCREYDRGQYSSMRLRKSELSVQQSMRLSRMIRRLRSSSAFSGIGTER